MAKGVYVGDSTSKARKVKKMYYGVGNLAKEIKKGYIGIGGVARPFWTSGPGEPMYYGKISDGFGSLSPALGFNSNYAIFVGTITISSGRTTLEPQPYSDLIACSKLSSGS